MFRLFFFNDTATTEIYTLSLHDALPILAIAPLVLLRLIAGLWVIDTVSLAVPVTVTPSGLVPWSVAVLVIERSEVHTCELQAHLNLVCRLLLDRKNVPSICPLRLLSPSL